MKIGEFSKKFNVTVSTVRHYINLGLLVPDKDGFQYRFTNTDCEEMEIIESMKDAGFKLNELTKYLNIFRFYNKDDYLLYEKLIESLEEKKTSLCEERNRINSCIQLINRKIKEIEDNNIRSSAGTAASGKEPHSGILPGLPLNAVSLLHCPHCGSKLALSNVNIFNDTIIDGQLTCSCGYNASVKNGIIFTGSETDLENDPQFLHNYFGNEYIDTNEDGILLMGMNDHSNELMINMHKSSLWLHKELDNLNLKGKTILFPDMACQYLYNQFDGKNTSDNLFLVTALTERTIHSMRQHIANANPDLKAVYIINQDGKLPLKSNCIDIIIDYMGSTNLGFFVKQHYWDMISTYITENAAIISAAEYYSKNTASIKKIHDLYPTAAAEVFTLDFINNSLERNGFKIEKSEKTGEGYDPGRFFEYHTAGDIRTNLVYLARRKSVSHD